MLLVTTTTTAVMCFMNWGQTVPSMLLFIPSKDGISHSIREYSAPEDLYRGAQLLMEMVQALDQEEGDM